MLSIRKETRRFSLELTVIRMGEDLCVSLSGGDSPHIGAVALAVPHPGLRDSTEADASVSLLTVTGHKEDELSRNIARNMAIACNCRVSVSCGIHVENAGKKDIDRILAVAAEMTEQAVQGLKY